MKSRTLLLLALSACAAPGEDVTLAELAPRVNVHVDVGPDDANVYLESLDARGFDPAHCPELHDVTVTLDDFRDDSAHAVLGGSTTGVEPGGGPLVSSCLVPSFSVPLIGHAFSPDEVTRIRIGDGATTVSIDARDVFATPTFTIQTSDGLLHAGTTVTLGVSPALRIDDGDPGASFTPDAAPSQWIALSGRIAGGVVALDVPADVPLGKGTIALQVFVSAPVDRCAGSASCSVTLNRDLEAAFDVTIAP